MNMIEIRKLKTSELTQQANQLRSDIIEQTRRVRTGELTNVRSIRAARKDLARLLTVISEQLIQEAK